MCTFSSEDEDEESCESFIKPWTALTNRGGLVIVSDQAFEFFVLVERKCCSYLNINRIALDKKFDIHKTAEDITSMEELYWSEITWEHVTDEYSTSLLVKMVTLYLTVGGFSFVRGWIEQLKKDHTGPHLPHTKSLRTGLKSKHKTV